MRTKEDHGDEDLDLTVELINAEGTRQTGVAVDKVTRRDVLMLIALSNRSRERVMDYEDFAPVAATIAFIPTALRRLGYRIVKV